MLSVDGEEEPAPELFGISAIPGDGAAVCAGTGETVGTVEGVCDTEPAAFSGSPKLVS